MAVAEFVRFVEPNHALELFGVRLVGVNAENGKKRFFTVVLIVVLSVVSKLLRAAARAVSLLRITAHHHGARGLCAYPARADVRHRRAARAPYTTPARLIRCHGRLSFLAARRRVQ